MTPRELRELVLSRAQELGFHRAGVTTATPPARYDRYRDWVRAGRAGEMSYMAEPRRAEARGDLSKLLPGVRSVVCVGLAYPAPDSNADRIAAYARGDDYHTVLHRKLGELAADLERAVPGVRCKSCVDTAPVLERELAERAGLGFVGKNTMLIAPGLGSYLVLGELLVDTEIEATEPESEKITSRCGSCTACLDACPTGAFPAPHVLDARRCISYLTIEQRDAIPTELRPAVGERVFGCDVCQQVCPFNAAAPARTTAAPELAPRDPERSAPDLLGLLALGTNQHRRWVHGTAMRRAGRAELRRNLCVALGNAAAPEAAAPLEEAAADPKAIVRRHAAWALGRLGETDRLRRRLEAEDDPDVRAEIEAAISEAI